MTVTPADDILREAYKVGYLCGIGLPDVDAERAVFLRSRNSVEDRVMRLLIRGKEKGAADLAREQARLKGRADQVADNYFTPPTHTSFTSYPQYDTIASIDAGVDDLP